MTTLWWGVRYDGIQFLPIFGRYFGNLNKNGLYLVFQLPNGDGKIQFLIENTTMTIFKQKFDGNTVVFEKINC